MRRTDMLWFLVVVLAAGTVGAESVGWRTDGTSVYPKARVGLKWAAGAQPAGIAWSVKLKNWSNTTPLVLGDRIITSEEPDKVVCLSTADGQELWRQAAGYAEAGMDVKKGKPPTEGSNGFTSPTAASDGKLVVTFNGLGVAACWDLAGQRQWVKFIMAPTAGWGTSSSVVLAGGKAIIHVKDVVYALDMATGTQAWQAKASSHWGTPVVVTLGEQQVIVTPGGDFIDAADGKILASRAADLAYNAPVVSGGVVYFMCGENGCKAVKLPEKIEAGWKPEVLWTAKMKHKDRTYSSPVLWDGMVYLINQQGWLAAFDAKTGESVWETKMKFKGTYYPSLVIIGQSLLVSSETGESVVVEPGRTYKELRTNKLDNGRATPVIVDDKMYVRSHDGMMCVTGAE